MKFQHFLVIVRSPDNGGGAGGGLSGGSAGNKGGGFAVVGLGGKGLQHELAAVKRCIILEAAARMLNCLY